MTGISMKDIGYDISDMKIYADDTMTMEIDTSNWTLEQWATILGGVPIVRCKNCKHFRKARNKDEYDSCAILFEMQIIPLETDEGKYCAWAERKTDKSDRPITCDYCKHWHGLKRDGRYWCSKHSAYMGTACEEGERNET